MLSPSEIRSRQGMLLDYASGEDPRAGDFLTAWAGGPDRAVSRLGAALANEAEAAVGIRADEVHAELTRRRDEVEGRIFAIHELLRPEVDELLLASREVATQATLRRLVGESTPRLDDAEVVAQTRLALARRQLDRAGEPYRLRDLQQQHERLLSAGDDQTIDQLVALAGGYREALGQHVPLGGVSHPWDPRSDPAATELLQGWGRFFPTIWLEHSAASYPIKAQVAPVRGLYSPAVVTSSVLGTRYLPAGVDPGRSARGVYVADHANATASSVPWLEIELEYFTVDGSRARAFDEPLGGRWIPAGDPAEEGVEWARVRHVVHEPAGLMITAGQGEYGVAIHELGHRFEECVPGISTLSEEFLLRRTLLADGTQQEPEALAPGAENPELARADRFAVAYMGRDYGTVSHHEVLSMGLEAIFGCRYGGMVTGREHGPDRDYRGFVLGLMLGLGKQ